MPGKTVGIVGLGSIESEIAKKIKCLGMRVVATKRNPSPETPSYVDKLIQAQNSEELLAESDFVILSLLLTRETVGNDR